MGTENKLTLGNNPLILGVCDGIAKHVSIDVVRVRIAFVLCGLFVGGGVLLYLILYWLIPFNKTEGEIRRKNQKYRTAINKES
jgi:phage shock protein PspC (stress-responsive transcriptional regulator)